MLFFIIVLRIFLGPIANVYQKKISNKGANSVFVVFVTYFIISVILFPFLFFINYQNLGIIFWKLIIITSLLDAAGNIFLVKALQTTDLSIFFNCLLAHKEATTSIKQTIKAAKT